MQNNTQPRVINFGCRVNAIEQHHMAQMIGASDYDAKDMVVVNSCAVTHEAERQLQQSLRQLRKREPNARIVLSGCAAQLRPDFYSKLDTVDMVVGNHEKLLPQTWSRANMTGNDPKTRVQVGDIMARNLVARDAMPRFGGRARAFVQVQTGCDHRCTFCTIPFARGTSQSYEFAQIVQQTREFADKGYQEVVLSGIDIASYRSDTGTMGLGGLINRLLDAVPNLPRLRISTLDCIDVDDEFIDALQNQPRLMPHLHMSLQSGDAMILKRMKRRHSPRDASALIDRMRRVRPDLVLGADIIVGFPTEDEEMFANSCAFVEQNRITWLHVFPYSERPGTPAAKIPQELHTPKAERLARARALRQVGERMRDGFLQSRIGAMTQILIEKDNWGKDPYFCKTRITSDQDLQPGQRFRAEITNVIDGGLQAKLLDAL